MGQAQDKKYCSHGFSIILVLVLVLGVLAIAGGIIYYKFFKEPAACTQDAKVCPDGSSVGRLSPNCDFAPCPADNTADWQVFQSQKYGFEIKYPKDFSLGEPKVSFLPDQPNQIVEIDFPEDRFPDTNFAEAFLSVNEGESQSAIDQCLKSVSESKTPLTVKKEINSIEFYEDKTSDAAAGNIYDSMVYRTIHEQACYEIILTIHTGNIGNYPLGTVKEVDKNQIWPALYKIFDTFKFIDGDLSSDWEAYQNLFFGFKHPKTWELESEKTGTQNFVSFKDEQFGYPGNGYLVFSITWGPNQAGLTLDRWWELQTTRTSYRKDSETKIGDFRAFKLILPASEAGPRYIFMTKEKGGYLYDISTAGLSGKIIDEILNSFELAPDTSAWQTYKNEEYGFEIKYPAKFKLSQDKESWPHSLALFISPSGQYYIIQIEIWDKAGDYKIQYNKDPSFIIKTQDEKKYLTINYQAGEDDEIDCRLVMASFKFVDMTPPLAKACVNSGGSVASALCCAQSGDFPNTCLIGACGCAPASSRQVSFCDCGAGKCFDGTECVSQ